MSDADLYVSFTCKAKRRMVLLTFTNFSLEVKSSGSLISSMVASELVPHIVDEATNGVRLQWLL